MQVGEVKEWLAGLLEGQPGVAAVEDYRVPGSESWLTDKVVRCEGDRSVFLRVVRTSPPTGAPPEGTVREPGVPIVVER